MDTNDRTSNIEKAQETGFERLWILGEWRDMPVKRVRSEWLVMNINNRRFTAERKLFESQLGRSLDPENNPNDALSVEAILLDRDLRVDSGRVVGKKPGKDYLALRQDWQNRKQESPFWIRPDGTVRNGNRRLAMLRRLHRDEGAGGNEYVDAVVLDPKEINEIAMFEMEQREQLTEDYKVRYTDINLLIAIKDAADDKEIDWYDDDSILRVAGELRHVMRNNYNYAVVQLYAIKYMDAYLSEFNQEDNYDKLINQIERFRDIGRIMRKVRSDDPDRELDMLNVLFAAINADQSYQKIRNIRTIFSHDSTAFDNLAANIADAEGQWIESTSTERSLGDPEVISAEDDSEDDDNLSELPGPVVPNYPKRDVKAIFEDAMDQHQVSRTSNILKTVKEINNRLAVLAGVDTTNLFDALARDNVPELRNAVNLMLDWFTEHQSSLR